jgi:hypothetical protein
VNKASLAISFFVCGCSAPPQANPQALNAVSDRCHAPRTIWKMITPTKVFYFFPDDLDRATRKCLQAEMKRSEFTVDFVQMQSDVSVEVQ